MLVPGKRTAPSANVHALSDHHAPEPRLTSVVNETRVVGDDGHVRPESRVVADRDQPRVEAIEVDLV